MLASESPYYVYMLTNGSGTLYVGSTNDLRRRLQQHRAGKPGTFTGKYHLTKLVYFESANGRQAAFQREQELKGWARAKKLELMRSHNPKWLDLAPQLGLPGYQPTLQGEARGFSRDPSPGSG